VFDTVRYPDMSDVARRSENTTYQALNTYRALFVSFADSLSPKLPSDWPVPDTLSVVPDGNIAEE